MAEAECCWMCLSVGLDGEYLLSAVFVSNFLHRTNKIFARARNKTGYLLTWDTQTHIFQKITVLTHLFAESPCPATLCVTWCVCVCVWQSFMTNAADSRVSGPVRTSVPRAPKFDQWIELSWSFFSMTAKLPLVFCSSTSPGKPPRSQRHMFPLHQRPPEPTSGGACRGARHVRPQLEEIRGSGGGGRGVFLARGMFWVSGYSSGPEVWMDEVGGVCNAQWWDMKCCVADIKTCCYHLLSVLTVTLNEQLWSCSACVMCTHFLNLRFSGLGQITLWKLH